MDGAVVYVEEFCAQVAFPECCDALVAEDIFESVDGAARGSASGVLEREGVGERMDLELESDFEDVEGSYANSCELLAVGFPVIKITISYLDTKPATAPATTTCDFEPCQCHLA